MGASFVHFKSLVKKQIALNVRKDTIFQLLTVTLVSKIVINAQMLHFVVLVHQGSRQAKKMEIVVLQFQLAITTLTQMYAKIA